MTIHDATPWLEDQEVGDELRSMLESAVEDAPTAKQLVSLESALATLLIPGGGGPGGDGGHGGGDGGAPGGGGELGHGGTAGGGAGAAGAGGAGAVKGAAGAGAAKGAVGVATAKGLGAVALSGLTKTVMVAAVAGSVAGGVVLQKHRTDVTRPVAAAQADVRPPTPVEPPSADEAAPVQADVAEPPVEAPPPPAPKPAPKRMAAAPAPEPEAPVAQTPPPPVPTKAANADAELALLQDAMDAVQSGRPSAALDALDSHAAQFAAGGLVQEREVLAIEVLVSLGRLDDAKARARRFRAAFPASTHLLHIDSLVGREP